MINVLTKKYSPSLYTVTRLNVNNSCSSCISSLEKFSNLKFKPHKFVYRIRDREILYIDASVNEKTRIMRIGQLGSN